MWLPRLRHGKILDERIDEVKFMNVVEWHIRRGSCEELHARKLWFYLLLDLFVLFSMAFTFPLKPPAHMPSHLTTYFC